MLEPVSFARALPLSLSRGPGPPVTEPLPRAPLSSLSAPWILPVSSAPSTLVVDRRVRTRARHRISWPRRPPTRPAPFLEPRQCPAHTPCLISHRFTLSRSLPSGADLSAPVSFARALSLSLSRGPGSPVTEPLPRAPFLLSLRRGPTLSVPPPPRSPWTGSSALVHVAGFLGHDARPRAQLPS